MRPTDRSSAGLGAAFALCARSSAALLAIAVIGPGCVEEKKPRVPTEEEIHSRDFETASRVRGRHLYTCDDNEPLFVDFKDNGLTLELRSEEQGPVQTLSAPSQGLQYVGAANSATMTGNELQLVDAQGRTRVCRKR